MTFRALRLDGFLSFAPRSEPFEFRDLNVLIGPNASGKTNFIEALRLLAATPENLAAAVQRRDCSACEWLWKGGPTDSAEIEAVLQTGDGRDITYRLRMGAVGSRFELLDEAIEDAGSGSSNGDRGVRFHYRFQGGNPVIEVETERGRERRCVERWDLLPDQSVLAQRKTSDLYPSEIADVGRAFSGIRIFDQWIIGPRAPSRGVPQTDMPLNRLLPGGSNLGLMLNHIEPSAETRINALLRRVFPRFERLSFREGRLCVVESGLRSPIPASRVSDGALRFVALLAILFSRSPPSLLCIEAPEMGLHPDAAALLGEVLAEASSRMQLIVTTHSEALISALSDQSDAVVACERSAASTALRRLSSRDLVDWLADYQLGDLWRMGELGANP